MRTMKSKWTLGLVAAGLMGLFAASGNAFAREGVSYSRTPDRGGDRSYNRGGDRDGGRSYDRDRGDDRGRGGYYDRGRDYGRDRGDDRGRGGYYDRGRDYGRDYGRDRYVPAYRPYYPAPVVYRSYYARPVYVERCGYRPTRSYIGLDIGFIFR